MTLHRYAPMLARTATGPFSSEGWIFEIKWDGIRALASVGAGLSITSRTGRDLLSRFPELGELAGLARNVVLDGEIIVLKDGRPDFTAVLTRLQQDAGDRVAVAEQHPPATYVVFDILEQNGDPVIDRPLRERLGILQEAVQEGQYVVRSRPVAGEGERYYAAVLREGLEGVIAKDLESRYEPGVRSDRWLKIVGTPACDCVVFGFTRGKGRRSNTFGALVLGLYDSGTPVFAGKVGTGFTDAMQRSLAELLHRPGVPPPAGWDAIPGTVTWIDPVLVVTVKYKSITTAGRFRMPRFAGVRPDKDPQACTTDQIVRVAGEYRKKRDFSRTSEPGGGIATAQETGNFVLQEHASRHHHFDFRLAHGGVLVSWAVPKGMPKKAGDKRLAIRTEDHPPDYASFEGVIPDGEYGAGEVVIRDAGAYTPLVWEKDKIEVLLAGKVLRGRYVLVRFSRGGENAWLILRSQEDAGGTA
ncbi:MAG: hypothetical protein GKC04_01660 [Methanomicrobiales archaeon]|nr:hypothetical protein [Methanomicrobiales archaeon]